MIQFWRNQPQLKPFIENGTLNPHLFHIHQKEGIDTDLPLSKWHSDKMVLIANYFFDSLYQNAFIRDENQIYPLDVCVPDHGKDGLTPTQLEFVTDKDTPGETFYRNPLKNGILLDHIGPNVNRFLMPDAAMDIIDYFSDSVSQILILSSDKGYFDFTHHFYPDHLSFQADGSLSTTVNFFALNRFIEICHQGSSITPAPSLPTDRLIFSSCALLTHGDIQKFGRLYKLLHEHFHRYTFCDYHIHQNLLTDCITYKNLQSLLALFKKTQYDPFILTRLIEPLKTVIQSDPYYEPSWLKPMLNHFAENTYYIPSKVANLTFFTVARIATILRMPEEARELINIHQELYGKNLHHYLLMGAHYFQLEDFKNAHNYYTQALQQDPDCPESIRHLELCENAIQT